jgi:BASS family bile acid:Na+ symporter
LSQIKLVLDLHQFGRAESVRGSRSTVIVTQTITQLLVLVFVVSTMLGVGLMLAVRDISNSLRDRRWVVRALLANFVVLPAIALGVSRLLGLDPVLTTSLLVLATAPGGPVLVKLATLVKDDPALAVGLVVILLLVGVVTQPLVLPLLLHDVTVSAGAIVRTLIFTVLVPLLIGLAVRARRPSLAARLQSPLRQLSTVSMILVMTLLPVVHWRELFELIGSGAFAAAVLFVGLSAAAGWIIGGPQAGPRRILALCCGQPNMAAAFVIANQNFSDPRVMLMLLVVMIAGLLILLPLTFFFARRPLPLHA